MSEHLETPVHPLSVGKSKSGKNAEAVAPNFLREGLLTAQKKTWEVFEIIRSQLKAGMTEPEAKQLALALFENKGVTNHWHRPYIRFGPGTALTFHNALQKDYRLAEGDPVYVDLGPVWADPTLGLEYEGDVGDTFSFGSNPEVDRMAETARVLFREVQREWKKNRLSGKQIYEYLQTRAEELGYRLQPRVNGHRLSDYPHTKYSKGRLSELPFSPVDQLWVLEVQILHRELPMGAFYEELL